jgi:GDP-4-dehydro-6-deoxy-D-mannose reductase
MTRILIIGISGFAGRHLYLHLKEISSVELFGTFNHLMEKKDRSFFKSDVSLLHCDIKKYDTLIDVLKYVQPEQIYFLSAFVTVAKSNQSTLDIYKTNITGAANFYEAVKNTCPSVKILAVGSAEQYGIVSSSMLPIREATPLMPVNSYGLSKSLAEQIGLYYNRVFNTDVRFTRTFHYSGPMQPHTFVISDFAHQIANIENGELGNITTGNLQAKRDFTDIRDVVRAYVLLMKFGNSGKIYNVCSGGAIKIQTILDKMIAFSRITVVARKDQKKFRPLDVPEFKGDNHLLVSTTGWSPEYEIDQTIEDVLNYWRTVQQSTSS